LLVARGDRPGERQGGDGPFADHDHRALPAREAGR
jgi:hypothetical protein